MGIRDEAFVGTLRRAHRAPDLEGGNMSEAGVTKGPQQTCPDRERIGLSPLSGSETLSYKEGMVGKGWCGPSQGSSL